MRFTVLLLLVLFTTDFAAAQRRAARSEVLTRMIAALGGEAFLNVREIHTAGRFFEFQKGELNSGDIFVDYIKLPDMERTEFGREKTRSVMINKADEGWTIGGKDGKEVEPQSAVQSEEFAANFKTSFDYVLRYVLEHPATTIQEVGSEIIDFKRVDVVELRDSSKNLIRFFVDRETRLPLKMQVRLANESGVREEIFANWHRFNGVMTPLFVGRFKDGIKTMEIRLESAVYNSGLSESLFTPPASK